MFTGLSFVQAPASNIFVSVETHKPPTQPLIGDFIHHIIAFIASD